MAQRGIATASNVFSRNLGSALGAAFFGAVFNFGLARLHGGQAIPEDQLRHLLRESTLQAAADSVTRLALGGALHLTFVALLLTSLGTIVLSLMLPKGGVIGNLRQAPKAS